MMYACYVCDILNIMLSNKLSTNGQFSQSCTVSYILFLYDNLSRKQSNAPLLAKHANRRIYFKQKN